MSEVRNCRKCGKIFTFMGRSPMCPSCRQADEDDFKKVKDYLYDHPGASLNQVSLDLVISVEKIKRFLKEGRIEIVSEEGKMFLECESCGKSLKSGRYCSSCERDLAANLKSTASQLKSEMDNMSDLAGKAVGMRYLNKESGKKI